MNYSFDRGYHLPEELLDLTLREVRERFGDTSVLIPALDDQLIIRKSGDIATLFCDLRDKEQEEFWVASLNSAHEVLGKHLLTIGCADQTLIHPREAFRKAIGDNAVAVVFCHNHPGGSIEPSTQDLETSRRLIESGEILGIRVLDHIIMARRGWGSAMPVV